MTLRNCYNVLDCDNSSGETCQDGVCVCIPGYHNSTGACLSCPGHNIPCKFEQCCSETYLTCYQGYCRCRMDLRYDIKCNYIGSSSTPMYITATQYALSAALIMGMAALSMVVYRLCTKPRYLSARQRALASQMGYNIENENLSYANYFRASLTSMQIRVLTRMRDRPPTYDNGPAPTAPPEAPPPYEGHSEGITMPPPYIEVVVSPTGYTNTTFVDPEADVRQVNRITVCPNCDTNQSTIDSNNCDKDKADETPPDKTETRAENRIPL